MRRRTPNYHLWFHPLLSTRLSRFCASEGGERASPPCIDRKSPRSRGRFYGGKPRDPQKIAKNEGEKKKMMTHRTPPDWKGGFEWAFMKLLLCLLCALVLFFLFFVFFFCQKYDDSSDPPDWKRGEGKKSFSQIEKESHQKSKKNLSKKIGREIEERKQAY